MLFFHNLKCTWIPIPSCRAFALGQEQLVGADWQGKGGQTRTLVINCSCWPRLEFPLPANPDLQDLLKRSVPILVTFCRDDQWTIYDNKTPWILHGGGFFVASPAHINGRDHWWNDGILCCWWKPLNDRTCFCVFSETVFLQTLVSFMWTFLLS
jgi:hypothetical protein